MNESKQDVPRLRNALVIPAQVDCQLVQVMPEAANSRTICHHLWQDGMLTK